MSPDPVASMGDDLARYRVSGASTIGFTPDNPLPKRLIHKIARVRLRETKARRAKA